MDSLLHFLISLTYNPLSLFVGVFLVALFGGEPAVLALSFLAASNTILPLWEIMLISYSTALIAEILWFYGARSKWINGLGEKYSESAIHQDFIKYFGKMERSKPFRFFLFARFISGLTVLVIIYLSRTKLPTRVFVRYCIIINAIWTPIVCILGWSAGKGFILLLDVFEGIQIATTIGISILIIVYLLYHYVARNFIQTIIHKK